MISKGKIPLIFPDNQAFVTPNVRSQNRSYAPGDTGLFHTVFFDFVHWACYLKKGWKKNAKFVISY